MASRLELQTMLEEILGSRNVYFQPPSSVQMKYPAIVYSKDRIDVRHADNDKYIKNISYSITVIDRDPESEISEKIAELPLCSFNRHFTSDNLNHDVFTLYY